MQKLYLWGEVFVGNLIRLLSGLAAILDGDSELPDDELLLPLGMMNMLLSTSLGELMGGSSMLIILLLIGMCEAGCDSF